MSTLTAKAPPAVPRTVAPPAAAPRRLAVLPTLALLVGAVYCLMPVAWVVIASTKNGAELFSTSTFVPGTGLFDNADELLAYRDGVFWVWMLNSALYAGGGALASAAVSGLTGYTLAKFRFPGRSTIFNIILAGVLVPQIILAIPQYLLLARVGLTNTTWRCCCRASSARTGSTSPGSSRRRRCRTASSRPPAPTARARYGSSVRSPRR
jgi:multiple sugar transport system permease protein